MKERKTIGQWIKEHKKHLLLGGTCIVSLIAIAFGVKHSDKLSEVCETVHRAFEEFGKRKDDDPEVSIEIPITIVDVQPKETAHFKTNDVVPFEVCRHIRNLPEGRHASQEKIAAAREENITLEDGQTWVEHYMKGIETA